MSPDSWLFRQSLKENKMGHNIDDVSTNSSAAQSLHGGGGGVIFYWFFS